MVKGVGEELMKRDEYRLFSIYYLLCILSEGHVGKKSKTYTHYCEITGQNLLERN